MVWRVTLPRPCIGSKITTLSIKIATLGIRNAPSGIGSLDPHPHPAIPTAFIPTTYHSLIRRIDRRFFVQFFRHTRRQNRFQMIFFVVHEFFVRLPIQMDCQIRNAHDRTFDMDQTLRQFSSIVLQERLYFNSFSEVLLRWKSIP